MDKKRISFYTSILRKMDESSKKQAIAGFKILSDVLSIEEGK